MTPEEWRGLATAHLEQLQDAALEKNGRSNSQTLTSMSNCCGATISLLKRFPEWTGARSLTWMPNLIGRAREADHPDPQKPALITQTGARQMMREHLRHYGAR